MKPLTYNKPLPLKTNHINPHNNRLAASPGGCTGEHHVHQRFTSRFAGVC